MSQYLFIEILCAKILCANRAFYIKYCKFCSDFSKTGYKIYYFPQHSKMAKWPNYFISGKQFQKGQMATLVRRSSRILKCNRWCGSVWETWEAQESNDYFCKAKKFLTRLIGNGLFLFLHSNRFCSSYFICVLSCTHENLLHTHTHSLLLMHTQTHTRTISLSLSPLLTHLHTYTHSFS